MVASSNLESGLLASIKEENFKMGHNICKLEGEKASKEVELVNVQKMISTVNHQYKISLQESLNEI